MKAFIEKDEYSIYRINSDMSLMDPEVGLEIDVEDLLIAQYNAALEEFQLVQAQLEQIYMQNNQ